MAPPNPEAIMQALGGHLAAKYLMVAGQVGLFEVLGQGALPLDTLARHTSLPPRTLRILADALVATGFLEREGDAYANSAVAATFLAGAPGPDMRPILRLWDQVVYQQWAGLEEALRTARATLGYAHFTPAQQEIFSLGVAALTAPAAQALAAAYDFSGSRAVLDLAGGTGSFLRALLGRYPHLRTTLVELPATVEVVRQVLAQVPGGEAIEIIAGDVRTDPVPPGYDTIVLANIVHLFSPATNRALLQRIRAVADAETRLLLIDFWTDPTHTQPGFAALMAGEFLIVSGDGDVYSVEEVRAWLHECGWLLLEQRPLAGPASLLIAAAAHPSAP